uniref:NADH dehydrogenase subunit 2 n=1 Tax=Limnocentropus hysbald TaxID=1875661 RepID=UPI0022DCD8FA|nr:NADH dehydrogenase subunit 2 [Limnocentropus hysbald]UZZ44117.1 NADH dehydrogenase subunit 2 [Limnocentropus hysbald]
MFININLSKKIFFITLIMSTLFSISSNSWLNAWMGMEMNLMSFIPLMINNKNSLSSESMMKYFLVQAISSSNFLFMILIMFMYIPWNHMNNYMNISLIILNLTLLMKMGAAPFHWWFPKVMKKISWMNCFILSSWQKIIPMIMISYWNYEMMLMTSIIMSTIIGSVMGFNQTSLQLIMSYSSINHIGWMLSSLLISLNLWMVYFSIYSFLTFIIMYFFMKTKSFHLMQIYSLKIPILMKFFFIINLISMGGLPPFLGFFPKWMIINYLMMNNMIMLIFIMIMTALINLYYYIRITYSFMMINYFEIKWFSSNKFNHSNYMSIMSYLSITSLIMSTLMFNFI